MGPLLFLLNRTSLQHHKNVDTSTQRNVVDVRLVHQRPPQWVHHGTVMTVSFNLRGGKHYWTPLLQHSRRDSLNLANNWYFSVLKVRNTCLNDMSQVFSFWNDGTNNTVQWKQQNTPRAITQTHCIYYSKANQDVCVHVVTGTILSSYPGIVHTMYPTLCIGGSKVSCTNARCTPPPTLAAGPCSVSRKRVHVHKRENTQ